MLHRAVRFTTPLLTATLLTACADLAADDELPLDESAVDVAELQSAPATCSEPEMTVTLQEVQTSSIKVTLTGLCHNLDWQLRRRIGNGPYVAVASGGTLSATFVDTGLFPETQTCYVAKARNFASPPICATTGKLGGPTIAVTSSRSAFDIEITDHSNVEDGFNVFHRVPATGAWELRQVLGTPNRAGFAAAFKVQETPGDDVTHCFRVSAFHTASGVANLSPEICSVLANDGPASTAAANWSLQGGGGTAPRLPRVPYRLRNLSTFRDLAFLGNLFWTDGLTAGNVFVERRFADSDAPVVEGEAVAIHVDGAGFLIRNPGAGADRVVFQQARDANAFQWKLVRPNAAPGEGQALVEGAIGLFNLQRNDFLVAASVTSHVELRWLGEPAP